MEPELTLSVIVSCYKQEAYIADCLHSILNQQVDFDYEIGQLNDLGMLKKVSNRKYEIELKGEVIGEIVAVTRFSL